MEKIENDLKEIANAVPVAVGYLGALDEQREVEGLPAVVVSASYHGRSVSCKCWAVEDYMMTVLGVVVTGWAVATVRFVQGVKP